MKLDKVNVKHGILHEPTDVVFPLAGHHRKSRDYHPLRPYGTQDWLVIYTKGGEGFCHANNSTIRLLPGDLLLIEPGRPHDYGLSDSVGKLDILWVHFLARPDWRLIIESLPEITAGYRVLRTSPKVRPLLVRIFTEIIRNAAAQTSFHNLFAMHHVERLFLAIYKRPVQKSARVLDNRILQVTHHIQNCLNLPLSLDDIAAKFGMSKFRLAHLFRAQMGLTPHRFIMIQRIRKACDLLKATTLTIAEIAYQTGFSNQGHFSYQFKRRMRCSPGLYRSGTRGATKYNIAQGKWVKEGGSVYRD